LGAQHRPKFAKIPIDDIKANVYAKERAKLIDVFRANCADPFGQPEATDHGTTLPRGRGQAGQDNSPFRELLDGGIRLGAEGAAGPVLQNRGSGFTLEKGRAKELAGRQRPLRTIIPAFMGHRDVCLAFASWRMEAIVAHAQFVSTSSTSG
jgi:gamma-glutamyltranspeptidase/glutathione hydrolase